MANLLVHLESFAWNDLTTNRAVEMDDLILAVDKVDEFEDIIYGHPDAYIPQLGWGTINDMLYWSESEYKGFTGGWFTNDHQKILLKLWRNSTPGAARNLAEMELEPGFENQNNGLIGCLYNPMPQKFVHNESSLDKLHQSFVWLNPGLRKSSPDYFYKHYRAALRVPAPQINDLISRKKVHSCFLRLDTPTIGPDGKLLHEEQIQMHFNEEVDNYCLNINGTWKHPSSPKPGKGEIPKEAREKLEEWGFILPPDQR